MFTAATAMVAGSALPSAALDVSTTSSERVLGDLQHEKIRVRLDDGSTARGDVLRFREDDENLDLRPRLAQRQILGLQQMGQMARQEVRRGAVVGTNGGYWIQRRSGNPNGLHMEAGRMLGSNASNASGGGTERSALGIGPSGGLLFDRLNVNMNLELADGTRIPIEHLNRDAAPHLRNTESLLYDERYGGSFPVPSGSTVLVLEELQMGASGPEDSRVLRAHTHSSATEAVVEPGTTPVLLRGVRSSLAADVAAGEPVRLRTRVRPRRTDSSDWDQITGALPAGPVLLHQGSRISVSEMREEPLSESHITGRQPRTAVGRTAAGEVLMVTIDGRRSGWSVGATLRDLQGIMLSLGARDAVNLDGGGSTTMTKGESIVNRPSETGRSVASGLFVYTQTPPAPRDLGAACPDGQVPSAGFTDTDGSVHASAIDCLAWWAVTQGTSATEYSPADSVTRAQMASFLARFIDNAAERGDANGLAAEATNTFSDVRSDNPHAQAIARLADADVVQGRGDGTYDPSGRVTRDQMASFIRRALEHASGRSLPEARDTFIDDNGLVHEESIDRLAGIGVASGVGGFDYRPRADVRRDAMASLLMRGGDFLVTEGLTTPPS